MTTDDTRSTPNDDTHGDATNARVSNSANDAADRALNDMGAFLRSMIGVVGAEAALSGVALQRLVLLSVGMACIAIPTFAVLNALGVYMLVLHAGMHVIDALTLVLIFDLSVVGMLAIGILRMRRYIGFARTRTLLRVPRPDAGVPATDLGLRPG